MSSYDYILSNCFFFFFNDTATTEIYTLSLHDALPISWSIRSRSPQICTSATPGTRSRRARIDRKSTRLNSSHSSISYAVFCLKKKKNNIHNHSVAKMNITALLALVDHVDDAVRDGCAL